MAHLNLRDRLIETTIAYVGAERGYGETTFAHVTRDRQRGRASELAHGDVDGAAVVSLDWRPRDGARLNDCELSVKLIAAEGPLDSEAIQRVLVDADGLVLILESDPAGGDRNRHAVAAVRRALSRAPAKKMPVVVQLNQAEGEDEPSTPTAVEVAEWPQVKASGATGDGVMETLQRAVDGVVESMQQQAHREPDARPAPAARAEGNPLLGALRQILQTTVAEQVASLEARLVGHIETRERSREGSAETWGKKLESFEGRLDKISGLVEEVRGRVAAASDKAASRDDVTRLSIRMVEDGAKADAVVAQVTSLAESLERLEAIVVETGARAGSDSNAASAEDVARIEKQVNASRDAVVNELKDVRKAIRDELVRVVGATQLMHKALESLMGEVKKLPTNEATARLDAALERVAAKTEAQRGQIDTVLAETRTARTDVVGIGSQMRELDATLGGRVMSSHEALQALGEKVDGRTEAIQTELTALIDEFKKRKKNWFG